MNLKMITVVKNTILFEIIGFSLKLLLFMEQSQTCEIIHAIYLKINSDYNWKATENKKRAYDFASCSLFPPQL